MGSVPKPAPTPAPTPEKSSKQVEKPSKSPKKKIITANMENRNMTRVIAKETITKLHTRLKHSQNNQKIKDTISELKDAYRFSVKAENRSDINAKMANTQLKNLLTSARANYKVAPSSKYKYWSNRTGIEHEVHIKSSSEYKQHRKLQSQLKVAEQNAKYLTQAHNKALAAEKSYNKSYASFKKQHNEAAQKITQINHQLWKTPIHWPWISSQKTKNWDKTHNNLEDQIAEERIILSTTTEDMKQLKNNYNQVLLPQIRQTANDLHRADQKSTDLKKKIQQYKKSKHIT